MIERFRPRSAPMPGKNEMNSGWHHHREEEHWSSKIVRIGIICNDANGRMKRTEETKVPPPAFVFRAHWHGGARGERPRVLAKQSAENYMEIIRPQYNRPPGKASGLQTLSTSY
jgi:hypothetical protein